MQRGFKSSAQKSQIHSVDYKNNSVDFVNHSVDYKNHTVDLRFLRTVFSSYLHRYLFYSQVQRMKLKQIIIRAHNIIENLRLVRFDYFLCFFVIKFVCKLFVN